MPRHFCYRLGMFNKVTFIGIGLIAGSMARDMRRFGLAAQFVAITPDSAETDLALALGLVDAAGQDYALTKGSDLIVCAVPVRAMPDVLAKIAPYVDANTVITDTGSVKNSLLPSARQLPHPSQFVPGHPIAGTEFSGPTAAVEDLFLGRWCIICPDHTTNPAAAQQITDLWQALGSQVATMSAAEHDRILAITSHLPHLIAFSIVDTAATLEKSLQEEVFKYAAGGFRDFTRIAASDPTMWSDIFLENKQAVLEMLGRFQEDLSALQRAIRFDDPEALKTAFTRAQKLRKGVIEAKQD